MNEKQRQAMVDFLNSRAGLRGGFYLRSGAIEYRHKRDTVKLSESDLQCLYDTTADWGIKSVAYIDSLRKRDEAFDRLITIPSIEQSAKRVEEAAESGD